jgi:hypothetical protein
MSKQKQIDEHGMGLGLVWTLLDLEYLCINLKHLTLNPIGLIIFINFSL